MERTLLLVDDEENITSALVRLLRRDGYTILKANSGKAGLELLTQHDVGVIISDQRMPEMTGVEFLSQVKELYPATVRIVLSGYTELNSVTDAINRGAIYKFLTKPWEDELLRANIEEAFRSYEMERENARLSVALQQANEDLRIINQDLERRVEQKTREVLRHMEVLRVSQEMLEHLPMAVVGVGQDGIIAMANDRARQLFCASAERPLLGEDAKSTFPPELWNFIKDGKCATQQVSVLHLADDKKMRCWCSALGAISKSQGTVLVIDTNEERYSKP